MPDAAPASILPPDQRGYADDTILVTTDWLAERLADGGADVDGSRIVVVDTDAPAVYAAGHIPGASNPPDNYYKTSLEDRTHIQGPAQFAETMQSLGIGDDSLVVAYDRVGGLYALRLMWALHYYRHTAVKMLDGGYQKWVAESRSTSVEPHVPAADGVTFTPREPDRSVYADQREVLAAVDDDGTTLLDVRTDAEWEGRNKRGGKRGGRIPGAVHLEWTNFHTGGDVPTLKTAAEINALLAEHDVDPSKPMVTYCQGGIRAAHAYWVAKLVGVDNVRNYDASWREWGNDSEVPVEAET